jgi:hypothetical protein
MKTEHLHQVSWILLALGIIGLIIACIFLQVNPNGLSIEKSVLDEPNNWPVYGKEIVACVKTNCNISDGISDNLNCQITEIANVTLGNYHSAPIINCSGYDGELHTHDDDCSFSPQDQDAFKLCISKFDHWLAVLKCGHNQYFYMTKNDFEQRPIKAP